MKQTAIHCKEKSFSRMENYIRLNKAVFVYWLLILGINRPSFKIIGKDGLI